MNALSALMPRAGAEPLPSNLEGACRAFEKEFAQLVFRKMREAMVPASGSGSSAFARETAHGMLDGQWAELASRGEGLGLWRSLLQELDPAVKSSPTEADQGDRDAGARRVAGGRPLGRKPEGTSELP